MGFYVRKSVRVGPFRFNLSKSGIGVSTGVPGFRVGTGPRGTYVHLGRGGLYFARLLALVQRILSRAVCPTPLLRQVKLLTVFRLMGQ